MTVFDWPCKLPYACMGAYMLPGSPHWYRLCEGAVVPHYRITYNANCY